MTLMCGDVGVVEVVEDKVQSKLHSIELKSGFRITINEHAVTGIKI